MKRNNKKIDLEKLKRSNRKVVLGFQVNPLIKLILVKQAEKRGLNLSQYVTEVIENSLVFDFDIIVNQNIDILNFSTRTYNCLKSANISTIKDLINEENDLKYIKHLGDKSFKEIEDCIKELTELLKIKESVHKPKELNSSKDTEDTKNEQIGTWKWKKEVIKKRLIPYSAILKNPSKYYRQKYPDYVYFEESTKEDKPNNMNMFNDIGFDKLFINQVDTNTPTNDTNQTKKSFLKRLFYIFRKK
jgi:hypothetical protein